MPLLVRYPGTVSPGTTNTDLVQNLDFAPTFLALAGVDLPEDMQGLSMADRLAGKQTGEWRDAIYYHYYEYPAVHQVKRHYGIRTQRYKLMHFYHDIDVWELYDLEKDPGEMNNVYEDPAYLDIIPGLMAKLKALQGQYGDSEELAQQMLESDMEERRKRIEERKRKQAASKK